MNELKKELETLKKRFSPHYRRFDDFRAYQKHREIEQRIDKIKKELKENE